MEFEFTNNESVINFTLTKIFDNTGDYEFCVNIKSGRFIISNKYICVSKNNFIDFYNKLNECYNKLNNEVKTNFEYDTDIILNICFKKIGHVNIVCDVFDGPTYGNKCHIVFETDQTCIKQTIEQLKMIIEG